MKKFRCLLAFTILAFSIFAIIKVCLLCKWQEEELPYFTRVDFKVPKGAKIYIDSKETPTKIMYLSKKYTYNILVLKEDGTEVQFLFQPEGKISDRLEIK